MNNKFEIQDILVAVDEILNNKKTSTKKNLIIEKMKLYY